ncbi:hypothetical protein [Corynebacterium variabile]|uniref:Uncharacterized protein n=1 Tax=Corynebacterium variabile TaxID=1727 RepID=A0A0X2NNK6_9CORY|nr:hypothetical protein [Corynebacterium variabile]CUU66310.1 hypothetical protein CVAR292_01650 [Corynebacterium variabile]
MDPSGSLTPDITDGTPATGPGKIVVSSKLLADLLHRVTAASGCVTVGPRMIPTSSRSRTVHWT